MSDCSKMCLSYSKPNESESLTGTLMCLLLFQTIFYIVVWAVIISNHTFASLLMVLMFFTHLFSGYHVLTSTCTHDNDKQRITAKFAPVAAGLQTIVTFMVMVSCLFDGFSTSVENNTGDFVAFFLALIIFLAWL